MRIEKNKELVYRWNIDGWGKGDLDVIDEVFAPTHVLRFNELEPKDVQRTTEQLKKSVTRFHEAMPDFHGTVDQLVAEGDMVAFHVIWQGTHTGTFREFAPTNKHWRWTDMLIARIKDGKVVEVTFSSKCTPADVFRKLAEDT